MEDKVKENAKESELMIYKPLPTEVRMTLQKQTRNLGSTSHFPLKNPSHTKEKKCVRNKKKTLTSIEKRKLGLHKLPKTGLKYKSFAALHKLWMEYMESVLDLEVSTKSANQDMLHQRIAKADYHGCLLMVTRSKCPSYIGVIGIVVLETKNTFQLICEDDKLKIIPKRDSVFTFTISRWTLTLFGNHMNIRPSERAARKFKSKPTIDL
uniref:Ribonuclease P protein subunit p29 n=1 Tax=Simocephalus serrulatus TaxID=117539 RepID=A0A4Y7NQ34_9CRUS|nr:EOG090X0GV5 [Simocephalus serrulatus]